MKAIQVIAITSGKGGVGKTQISINLAISLAQKGLRVGLLDGALVLPNVDVALGLDARFGSADVFSGRLRLREVVVRGPESIRVVPSAAGGSVPTSAELAGLIYSFDEIADDLDLVIIDTASGIDTTVIRLVCASQEVVVVACDEPTSVSSAYALIKLFRRDHGIDRFHLLSNMTRSSGEGRHLYRKMLKLTERFLDVALHYVGAVPFDIQLRAAARSQRAVAEVFPHSKCAIAFNSIAERICDLPLPVAPKGDLEFFFARRL